MSPTFSDKSVLALAWMMFLVPALGVPSLLMLQDTLKSAVAAFGILFAALMLVWPGGQRRPGWLWHGMLWVPISLMAYAFGSMVWSHTFLAGVEGIRWFLLSLLLWVGLTTLNLQTAPKVIWGMHGGLVVASLWTVLQFWWDFKLFPQGPQPASSFVNRNFFAEYAVTVLPFSVWVLVTARRARWLPWVAASVAINVLALLMTGTRSALIALFLLIPVLLLVLTRYRTHWAFETWNRSNRIVVAFIMVMVIGGGGSIPSGNAQVQRESGGQTALERSIIRTASIAQRAEYTTGSISIRTTMWMATARMMLAQPWTGVGAGAWEVQVPRYQRVDSVLENDYYAHNELLQLLSEYGVVVGGLGLAFFFAYLLQAAAITWHLKESQNPEAPLRAVALCSLLALLIVSNAGFPWHLAACGCMLSLNMALLGSSDRRLRPQDTPTMHQYSPPEGQGHLARAVLVGCLCLALYITWQAQQAEKYLTQAIQLALKFGLAEQSGDPAAATFKAQALDSVRAGIAVNPHYRRLTAEVAEPFAARGDWKNATWILESVASSRPNVPVIWKAIAAGYAHQGDHQRAEKAFQEVQRLRPDSFSTVVLRTSLLTLAGRTEQAAGLLHQQLSANAFDFELVQTAYAIGYKTQNWELAERSLEALIRTWPEQAADGYFRLGKLYTETPLQNPQKAIQAFKSGLAQVPDAQRQSYIEQVPNPLRSQM